MSSFTERRAGVLLHITSLPGAGHLGDLGSGAYQMVDFLAAGGQTFWQVLPIHPIGLADSPYSSSSAFAGEPLLIDVSEFYVDGLIKKSQLKPLRAHAGDKVDYKKARAEREPFWQLAFQNFRNKPRPAAFKKFVREEKHWLRDFALFSVFCDLHAGKKWFEWPAAIRHCAPAALRAAEKKFEQELEYVAFLQFYFFKQWRALKSYANKNGLQLVGDMPIFIGYHSADVWSRQSFFEVNRDGTQKYVAGCPPDFFCPEGQLWGMALYNWRNLKKAKFSWWLARFKHVADVFDVTRIDHFIGFYRYWEIAATAKDAKQGTWRFTPGHELFSAAKRLLGGVPFIAEDLGLTTPEVFALREAFAMPGMRVLQFGFGNGGGGSYHMPHNYPQLSVAYTGTHDNNTARGWFLDAQRQRHKKNATYNFKLMQDYLGCDSKNAHEKMILTAMKSPANMCIIPLQDWLGLDGRSKMNVPGIEKGNWRWRLLAKAMTPKLAQHMKSVTATTQRLIQA